MFEGIFGQNRVTPREEKVPNQVHPDDQAMIDRVRAQVPDVPPREQQTVPDGPGRIVRGAMTDEMVLARAREEQAAHGGLMQETPQENTFAPGAAIDELNDVA